MNMHQQKIPEIRTIIPNEIVYRELESITETSKRRLSFFGHIMRMPDSKLLKQLV